MNAQVARFRKSRRGQGMTEYIIIVALIAIAAIGIITVFGDNLRKLFWASSQSLAGATNFDNPADQGDHANLKEKNMDTAFQNNAPAY